MSRRSLRTIGAALVLTASLVGCSAEGSHSLSCQSTEVAPNSQPGSKTPRAALDWYLRNGRSGLPTTGFRLSGHSATRYVYSDGTNQVSVSALPTDKGQPRIWVVLMTFDCS